MRCLLLVVAAVAMGWLFASFVCWLGWSTQVEGRAFRCNDDTYPFVWFTTDLDAHRQAGDTLASGWTWERIRRVQRYYVAAFYTLWFFAMPLAYLALFRFTSKSPAEPGAPPNGGPATRLGSSGVWEGPPSVS
jgi:hypothetical protein